MLSELTSSAGIKSFLFPQLQCTWNCTLRLKHLIILTVFTTFTKQLFKLLDVAEIAVDVEASFLKSFKVFLAILPNLAPIIVNILRGKDSVY